MNEVYILISCPSHLPKEYQKILDARAVAYINVDRAGEGKSSDQWQMSIDGRYLSLIPKTEQ